MNKTAFTDSEYYECIKDLINHEKVLSMRNFPHHRKISCLEHSLSVSYLSYRICKKIHANSRSVARAGLLHDFFLYDWHATPAEFAPHAFVHPKTAAKNADKYFTITKKEREAILHHMWPITIVPPYRLISLSVMLSDKYCALLEVLKIKPKAPCKS